MLQPDPLNVYTVVKWTFEYITKQTACYQSNPSMKAAPHIGNFMSATCRKTAIASLNEFLCMPEFDGAKQKEQK